MSTTNTLNTAEPLLLQHDDPYVRKPWLKWLALLAALMAWGIDGIEQNMYALMTRDVLKDLIPKITNEDVNRYFGYSMAMWLWGAAVGGVFFGRIGDRFGRAKGLALAVFTYATCTGLLTFATHWYHLMICRFVGAIGLGGTWGLCVALIVETWPERRRPLLAGCVGAAANVGFLIAALYSKHMTDLGYDWRWVFRVDSLLGFIALPLILCVPEPAQWKLSKQKKEKSRFSELFSPEYRRNTIVGSLLATVALLGTWGSFLWLSKYMNEIAVNTDYAKTAGMITARWASIGQIGGGFLGGLIITWLGIRFSWCLLCILAWAGVTALYGFNTTFSNQAIVMAIFVSFPVAAFFGWLPKFLPELFPLRIRASGQGFSYNIGRVLAGIGAIITGILGASMNSRKGAMCMAGIYLIGLIVIWFAPDTKGKMMDEATSVSK